jgi:FkbM family methyltransferase
MEVKTISEPILSRGGHALLKRWKSLQLRLAQRLNSPIVKSSYGVRFAANYMDATFRFYIKASYGFFYWKHISAISEDFIYLDIGANQGLYSICAGLNRHCQRAYAFEPVPNVVHLLRQNLALNGVADKCEVVQKAVSDQSGDVEIAIHTNHSGEASIAQGKVSGAGVKRQIIQTINAKGLEAIIQTAPLPIYVKIDVEGHEEVVVKELLNCSFAGQIREIFYEVDVRWVNPQVLQSLLQAAGFQSVKIGSQKHYDVLATRG